MGGGQYIELYKEKEQLHTYIPTESKARDKAFPGLIERALWDGGGKSANVDKGHCEWPKVIAPVGCVNKGEGGCSHIWGAPKRAPSLIKDCSATMSPRRPPIDVPRRGEEVVEPASVQAAILLPGSPPSSPELAAIQMVLAGAAESEEGSDASSHGSNKSVDVGGSDHVFDMELDETNANQPGATTGAFAPHLVARAAVVHPNNSDVSSLDIGPGMASEDEHSEKSRRQPRLDQHGSAANVLSTSCPVTFTAPRTSATQGESCEEDQTPDATDNGEYHYRNFSSSSEEDEEEILFMKGPKKSD